MKPVFNLEIVAPQRKFYSDEVEMVVVKTPNGEVGILAGHVPVIIVIEVGPIRIKKNGEWFDAVLSEGYMEVQQDKAIIIVDSAEWPHEIDENRAKAAKERAEERLRKQLSKIEYVSTQAALARAMARLRVKRDLNGMNRKY